ncbi:MAG: DUF1631 domain-containing protein [Pseudomonadota bacterium]
MSQPKVVALSSASKKTSALPPIVHTMRQHSRKQLATLLEGLFNNIDDALFEMADRSRSDADQHLYFESMRELRLKRQEISKAFTREYTAGFEAGFKASSGEPVELETDFDNLGMLDNDELEISVAVAGITSKVTSQYSLLIMQLTKRLDHLAGDVEVSERSNPMGPEQLSQVFVSALASADLDIKVRIILLKLFERFVMERLSSFYTDANQMLADAGVLTDLKDVMRRERRGDRSERSERENQENQTAHSNRYGAADQAGSQSAVARQSGFQAIQELLAASRAVAPLAMTAQGGGGPSGPPMSTTEVLTALNQAQAELEAPIDIETVPAVLDLRQLVLKNSPDSGKEHLAQADDDVVNFVGMLFDYILNDRNLAIPMKALIGRLQLPIVRLAIVDRAFFDQSSHPARQLLNELSSAGIGWSSAKELKRDALYNKVEAIVLRVMNGFKEDGAIFEELLDDLRSFVKNDSQKRDQIEQRVKDNEQGRARTINAKQTVQQLINQKASGMRLPAEIGRFISATWSKVLVYTCVKEGEQATTWHEQTETLDQLLWCLQPLDSVDDMNERDSKVAGLLEELRQGMATIQIPTAEVDRHLEEIERHLANVSANDRAYVEEDEPAPQDDDFEIMDDIVLTLPGEQIDVPEEAADIEPEYLEQIGKLREGGWVELTQPSGEVLRCKLSTIIEPGGRYIFVNRRGMKVAERSRRGLAVELKREGLKVLEESQVFDRALQAVIGNLRQMHRAPSAS